MEEGDVLRGGGSNSCSGASATADGAWQAPDDEGHAALRTPCGAGRSKASMCAAWHGEWETLEGTDRADVSAEVAASGARVDHGNGVQISCGTRSPYAGVLECTSSIRDWSCEGGEPTVAEAGGVAGGEAKPPQANTGRAQSNMHTHKKRTGNWTDSALE